MGRPCKGKLSHVTAALAEQQRRELLADKPQDEKRDARLVVYRCDLCGLWHVGHKRAKPAPYVPKPKGPTPGEAARMARRKLQKDYLGDFFKIVKRLTELELRNYPRRNA